MFIGLIILATLTILLGLTVVCLVRTLNESDEAFNDEVLRNEDTVYLLKAEIYGLKNEIKQLEKEIDNLAGENLDLADRLNIIKEAVDLANSTEGHEIYYDEEE